jgi:hypothetical protein
MDLTHALRSPAARRLTRPGIADLLAYWEGLRHGASAASDGGHVTTPVVPPRAAIDPMAIKAHLRHAGIAERTPAGTVRLRLGGAAFAQVFGMEAAGMPLRALFAPPMRPAISQLFDAVFDGPKVLTATLIAERKSAPALTGQLAMMPLTDGHAAITRALVGLVTDPYNDDVPLRFRLRHAHLAHLADPDEPPAEIGRAPRPSRISVARGDGPRLRIIDGGLA